MHLWIYREPAKATTQYYLSISTIFINVTHIMQVTLKCNNAVYVNCSMGCSKTICASARDESSADLPTFLASCQTPPNSRTVEVG